MSRYTMSVYPPWCKPEYWPKSRVEVARRLLQSVVCGWVAGVILGNPLEVLQVREVRYGDKVAQLPAVDKLA